MAYYVNGDIKDNDKYRDMVNRYLTSDRFRKRCEGLKNAIEKSEKEKKLKKEEQEKIEKAKTINLF